MDEISRVLFVDQGKRRAAPGRQAEAVAAGSQTEKPKAAGPAPKPLARTQQERRSEAEHRLLMAARETLARKGWSGMTLADVGEAAGYSRGLAGHYFGSKAGLLRAITSQINNSLLAEIKSRPQQPSGLEAVVSFVTTYLGRRDPRWTNTRVILILLTETLLEGSENSAEMLSFNASMFTYLEANIRLGIENGQIDPLVTPSVAAEFIVGTLRGVMLQRLVKGEVGAATLSDQLASLVRRSLATKAPERGAVRADGAGKPRKR